MGKSVADVADEIKAVIYNKENNERTN
jgi:hypothetical protein